MDLGIDPWKVDRKIVKEIGLRKWLQDTLRELQAHGGGCMQGYVVLLPRSLRRRTAIEIYSAIEFALATEPGVGSYKVAGPESELFEQPTDYSGLVVVWISGES